MIKEFKKGDARFAIEATGICYFVHVGISAQKSTVDLKGSDDKTTVKESIKEAVRKELSYHSAHLEKLQNMVDETIIS